MKLMVVGASKGLGRAFVEGLCAAGDNVVGVSRGRPNDLKLPDFVCLDWIEADLGSPLEAANQIEQQSPSELDVLIYNLGVWEEAAFTDEYEFLGDSDESIVAMVNTNITGTILLLKRLIPKLLVSANPLLVLTGSTSGLRQSGRPEVTFGASKFALTGIGDTLRENFRNDGLAVTCLQLGYLNTEDSLAVSLSEAVLRGDGQLVPVHDVVNVVKTLINMSNASYVRELVLPAIRDERF
ncbi:SDR family NAD(P)-dependent oxidoreductase [Marinomonas sp. BSi20584]|uniref:SDR family NAD(P)-dependent oxidoreductase n=1 Tax=Marinomonas sp. BSi20584 TaxID=1594462 RepID=UPI000C1E0100|nr:SDR family oxidoreductase [Marinomonas sp. BSi20584]PJE54920.1 dehydrogenase [Marinomonas sp. BSi20584]